MGKSIEFVLTKGKKGWASEQKTHGKQVFSFCVSSGWDRVKESAFVPKNKYYLESSLLAV